MMYEKYYCRFSGWWISNITVGLVDDEWVIFIVGLVDDEWVILLRFGGWWMSSITVGLVDDGWLILLLVGWMMNE